LEIPAFCDHRDGDDRRRRVLAHQHRQTIGQDLADDGQLVGTGRRGEEQERRHQRAARERARDHGPGLKRIRT
jgi:hypothetical protein